MGKKSKRKKSTNTPPPCCYHGCTKKEFNSGEHRTILDDFTMRNNENVKEFIKTHERFMVSPTFGNFVIARITHAYLTGKVDEAILCHSLLLLLQIRYVEIPWQEGKDLGPESENRKNFHKYSRDIATERGRINCMAREIPCDCMEEKRIKAKSMEKVAMCFCCREEFLKEKMLRCKGCGLVQYCSKECSIKEWPNHKVICSKYGISAAPASTPRSSPRNLPSLVEEPTVEQSREVSLPVLFGSLTHTPATGGSGGNSGSSDDGGRILKQPQLKNRGIIPDGEKK